VSGDRESRGCEQLAHPVFVAAGDHGGLRMPLEAELCGRAGGEDDWPVGYGHKTADRSAFRRVTDRLNRELGIIEADSNRAVSPGIIEDVAAVRREKQFDPERPRGVREGLHLITGGRRE
jgi:hypothetical protein